MDWTIPCYNRLPDPVAGIRMIDYTLPVIRLPQEILSKRLRDQGIFVYALLGFMAPPGNIKRIPAEYMIDQAIRGGVLKEGGRMLEGTSGNMGVALAYCAKEHGVTVYALVADDLAPGKQLPLKRHGAVVISESAAARELGIIRSSGRVKLAAQYAEYIGAVYLNQYAHPWNPQSYEKLVAPELWGAVGGRASLFVAAVGSTGTLLGLGRYFRKRNPCIKIVATMPYLGQKIEGARDHEQLREIGHDWQKLKPIEDPIDERTARAASALLNENGIPAGPSSGGAFATAEHFLLNRLAGGTLNEMRDRVGEINVILPFADTLYPYA